MSTKHSNDEKPLNIPSFLSRPARPSRVPHDEEVDAMMKSVHEAAGVSSVSVREAAGISAVHEAATIDLEEMEEPPLDEAPDEAQSEEAAKELEAAILNTPDKSVVPEVDPLPVPRSEEVV